MGTLVNYCAGAELKKRPQKANAYLINAPEHGSTPRRIEKVKQMLQETQPQFVMVDSGGYQLLTAEKKEWTVTRDQERKLTYRPGEMNLSPNHVMAFAATINADIVIGLDAPVGKFKTVVECEIEFQRKFPLNIKWARESAKWRNRLCPDARLFLPFQGYNTGHLDEFFYGIDGIQYDGVAIPLREAKLHDVALFLVNIRQRGIQNVHLLGTASFQIIALAAYMSNHLFEWVSLDATTWNTAAFYCRFLNPHNLGKVDLRLKEIIDPTTQNDCPCQFCQGRSFSKIQILPNKEKFELLRQHNWWVIDKAVQDFENNSSNLVQLERFLMNRNIKQTGIDNLINTLALASCMKEEDIEVLEAILSPIPKTKNRSHQKLKKRNQYQQIFETKEEERTL